MIGAAIVLALCWVAIELRQRRLTRREVVRARRRERDRLARDGWDVLPRDLIGPDGPVLRDTPWNRARHQLEQMAARDESAA